MPKVIFKVSKILPPFEKYDKKFYPVATSDLRGKHGDLIFNAQVEIPEKTDFISGELYTYKGEFKIKNIQPYDLKGDK